MSKSVRSRIEEFEAFSRSSREEGRDNSNVRRNEAATEKRRRFTYPRNFQRSPEPPATNFGLGPTAKPRHSGLANFEADLQEVWSVRKNIHHTGKSLTKLVPNGVQVTGQYSRHGAVPAQQSHGPQTLSTKDTVNKGGFATRRDNSSFKVKRSPLQEHNLLETKWDVRTTNTFSSEMSKGPTRPPHHDTSELLSPPTAKRKTIDVIRATGDRISPTKIFPRKESNEKVRYAKKMAQGYLRSVGIGEYTPKGSSYSRDDETRGAEGRPNRWRKLDHDQDEFDFDV